eukprot:TRINITY_DN5517_c0_g1_i1.p1 TRINITY_DN5517_c0_g1~~TRINITY_DN5517_c0_g1_i1.p1  ORF type:complete len:429 (-),score=16.49 TRINITY_DN5517_c0_g1_i1:370-1656(-)
MNICYLMQNESMDLFQYLIYYNQYQLFIFSLRKIFTVLAQFLFQQLPNQYVLFYSEFLFLVMLIILMELHGLTTKFQIIVHSEFFQWLYLSQQSSIILIHKPKMITVILTKYSPNLFLFQLDQQVFFQLLSMAAFLGLHKSVVNSNPGWDLIDFDKSYQAYCGCIIVFCLILIGLAIAIVMNFKENLQSMFIISILLGIYGTVALSFMKQSAFFEGKIAIIFVYYQSESQSYADLYQSTKEHSFLNIWDWTHVMDSICLTAYHIFYLWLILYITQKLKLQNILRHILYGLQIILAAVTIVAFALLYYEMNEFFDDKFRAIMITAMIFNGFLVLFGFEHFLIRKENRILKLSKRTIITGLIVLALLLLQGQQEPDVPEIYNLGKYKTFTLVTRALLMTYLPLQLESEIIYLFFGITEETEEDSEKFITH